MELVLDTFVIDRIVRDAETRLDGRTLRVDVPALERHARQDPRLAGVEVDAVDPGESTRIVHVIDAIEPRVRLEPEGPGFPGVTGPAIMAGHGRTARLGGMAVVLAGLPPGAENPSFWQELSLGVPRVVRGVAITHVLGDPALPPAREADLRRGLLETAVRALAREVSGPTLFEPGSGR